MTLIPTCRPFPDAPSIRLIGHLPNHLAPSAASLYLSALADLLVPIFGVGHRARNALASGFNRRMCICVEDDDQLIGLLGIQTEAAGFMDVTFSTMKPLYGIFGSLWRVILLEFLHHSPMAGEAHIDGVVVAPTYRGRGIGTAMIAALAAWATGKGLSMVSLEVVNTNTQAQKLYRCLGFEAAREQSVWPMGSLLGVRSSTVMIKRLA